MQHSLPVLFAEYPVSHSLITSAVLSDLWMMIRRSDQVLTWPIRRLGWFWSTVLAEHEYYSCSCTSMTSSCNSCSFLHRVRTQSSHGGPLSCRMMVVDEGIFRAVHRSRGNWTDFDGWFSVCGISSIWVLWKSNLSMLWSGRFVFCLMVHNIWIVAKIFLVLHVLFDLLMLMFWACIAWVMLSYPAADIAHYWNRKCNNIQSTSFKTSR